ncbi:MAG: DUF11 domain-containing protein [Thermoflexales bacterium]|nr:DUF11 domain-containing protein [Thermoflexales bacterium]
MGNPLAFDKRIAYLALAVGIAVLLVVSLPAALRTAVAQGSLSVSVTLSPATVRVGDYLIYTVVVSNSGSAVTGAQVVDTLPAEASFASCTATQGTCTGTSGTIWTGDVGANGSVTITYMVRVNSMPASGLLSNTFTVTPGNASATISVALAADFGSSIKIASSTVVTNGELLTYTIYVRNTGGPATGVTVVETPSVAAMVVPPCWASKGTCTAQIGVIWTGDMAPGEVVVITYVVRIIGGTLDWPVWNVFSVNGTPMATTEARLNPQTPPTPTDTPTPTPTSTERPRPPRPTDTPVPTVTPIPTPFELPETGGAAPPGGIVVGLLVVLGWTLGGLVLHSRRGKERQDG